MYLGRKRYTNFRNMCTGIERYPCVYSYRKMYIGIWN